MIRTIAVLAVIALVGVSFLTFGAFAATPALALQDDVKQVYLNKCAVCHGEDGAGKTAKGKKLKMKDVRAPEVQKMTPAQWTDAILKGSGQDMDGFEKELGVEMSRKLAAYMRDLAKK
jgi:mono/diheme cytochrome c family protein